jgi:hypothetical protein
MSLSYALYTELAVGADHPSLSDVINRPLKEVLVSSGLAEDVDPFPGFLPLAGGTRTISSLIMTSTLVLGAASDITVNTDKFTVNASTGDTVIGGSLTVVGSLVFNSDLVVGQLEVTTSVFIGTTIETLGDATFGGNTNVGLDLDVTGEAYIAQSLEVGTTFGCNGAIPQAAAASGGALAAYAGGANGLSSGAEMAALHALVVAMRAALVANGIMS